MLDDIEKLVVETIRMRLTTQQALENLKDNEFPVSRATYFRHKRRVEEKKLERFTHIAKIGFEDQHLQRVDGLEIIEKMCDKNIIESKTHLSEFKYQRR